MRHRKNGEDKLEKELEESKRELKNVKGQRPSVDKLVKDLRDHLQENSFGLRLYLQMIEGRR